MWVNPTLSLPFMQPASQVGAAPTSIPLTLHSVSQVWAGPPSSPLPLHSAWQSQSKIRVPLVFFKATHLPNYSASTEGYFPLADTKLWINATGQVNLNSDLFMASTQTWWPSFTNARSGSICSGTLGSRPRISWERSKHRDRTHCLCTVHHWWQQSDQVGI